MKYFIIGYRGTKDGINYQGDCTCECEIYPSRKELEKYILDVAKVKLAGIVFINEITKEEKECFCSKEIKD